VEQIAGWVATIATMVAAVMVASNLGARITGWGFVVFTAGSVAWTTVGATTDQPNLLITNAFLTIINLLGVWRWLGRQARYEQRGKSAVEACATGSEPVIMTASALAGAKVYAGEDEEIGSVVEVMLGCADGRIHQVVVRSGGVGGVGERLRAIDRDQLRFAADRVDLLMERVTFDALPEWVPDKPADAMCGG